MSTEDLEKRNSGEELTEVEGELVSGEDCDPAGSEAESPAESRRQERKRRLASGAVALVTSASVLVGGLFNSPALMPDDENPVPQIVCTENDDDDLDGNGDGGDGSHEQTGESAVAAAEQEAPPEVWEDERRKLRVPLAVRLLAIPLAGVVCWLIFSAASALFASALGAALAKLLAWVLLLAGLLGGFAAAVKTVFPDLPLRKILNKRSISGVLIGGAALAAADIVLPLFWAEYTRVEAVVRALGILAVIGTAAGSFIARENKRRRAEAEAAAEEPSEEEEPDREEEEKPMTREDILALADTVSRKR